MNWTDDKVKHYQIGYKFGRFGSIFGFLVIALILAPGKELYDYFMPGHCTELDDYLAGVYGAFDGMLFLTKKH